MEYKYERQSGNDNYMEFQYILYNQKELKSFVFALGQLVVQLNHLDYEDAEKLNAVFLKAVRESKYFLPKYLNDLWEAMVVFMKSIYDKGAIFTKWCQKIVS